MRRRAASAAVGLVTALLLGAGGAASAAGHAMTLEAMPDPAPAPDVAFEQIGGGAFRLAELRGQVVVVNFWATWCPPCRRELPSLERLNGLMKDERGFAIVGIDEGETPAQIAAFMARTETPPTFRMAIDAHGGALKAYGMRGLPTTYVIDRQGRIVFRALGPRLFDDPAVLDVLRQLVRKP